MNKKPISFGKISFNLSKSEEKNNEKEANAATSGFGTFGRTPIQEHHEIEKITDDLESQHVQEVMGIKNFGKKAKSFNLQEMVEQAKKTAKEANKRRIEAEAANTLSSQENNEVMGPLPQKLQEDTDDEDLIGPPIPTGLLDKDKIKRTEAGDDKDTGEDSYDELSGSDDEELSLEKRIPNTHEVSLHKILDLILS